MTEKISMKDVTIIEAGPEDSISVHTYYGDDEESIYKGKHIIIRHSQEQNGRVVTNTEKHSLTDLQMSMNIMVNDSDHCHATVMSLMSRETEFSKSIRALYREYGFDRRNEGVSLMIKAVGREIEGIECMPVNI